MVGKASHIYKKVGLLGSPEKDILGERVVPRLLGPRLELPKGGCLCLWFPSFWQPCESVRTPCMLALSAVGLLASCIGVR